MRGSRAISRPLLLAALVGFLGVGTLVCLASSLIAWWPRPLRSSPTLHVWGGPIARSSAKPLPRILRVWLECDTSSDGPCLLSLMCFRHSGGPFEDVRRVEIHQGDFVLATKTGRNAKDPEDAVCVNLLDYKVQPGQKEALDIAVEIVSRERPSRSRHVLEIRYANDIRIRDGEVVLRTLPVRSAEIL